MSKQPENSILRGNTLLALVRKATSEIQLLVSPGRSVKIPNEQAVAIVEAGNYEGVARNGRIRYIRETREPLNGIWQQCWRTSEASVVPVHAATGNYSFGECRG